MELKKQLDFGGNKAELATLLWKSSASVQAGKGAKWNVWDVRFDYDLERKIRPIQRHRSTSPLSPSLSLLLPARGNSTSLPTRQIFASQVETSAH